MDSQICRLDSFHVQCFHLCFNVQGRVVRNRTRYSHLADSAWVGLESQPRMKSSMVTHPGTIHARHCSTLVIGRGLVTGTFNAMYLTILPEFSEFMMIASKSNSQV